jgi:hypothetical protein
MKNLFKSISMIAILSGAFGIGCVTESQGPVDNTDPAATSQTEQDIGIGGGGGGGSCPAKDNCYSLCRFIHNCGADSSQCTPLGQCLDSCDAEFPTCS